MAEKHPYSITDSFLLSLIKDTHAGNLVLNPQTLSGDFNIPGDVLDSLGVKVDSAQVVVDYLVDLDNGNGCEVNGCNIEVYNRIEPLSTVKHYFDIYFSPTLSTSHKFRIGDYLREMWADFNDKLNEDGHIVTVLPGAADIFSELPPDILRRISRIALGYKGERKGRYLTHVIAIAKEECDEAEISLFRGSDDSEPVFTKTMDKKEFFTTFRSSIEAVWLADMIPEYKNMLLSGRKTVVLGEVFAALRGSSIPNEEPETDSPAGILQISDIGDEGIDYSRILRICVRKSKIRNELTDGDLILTARGTKIKSALFRKQDIPCLASGNLLVLRNAGRQTGLTGAALKIFFDSEVGNLILRILSKSGDAALMQLNPSELKNIVLPVPDEAALQKAESEYTNEYELYSQTVSMAQKRWENVKRSLEDTLFS